MDQGHAVDCEGDRSGVSFRERAVFIFSTSSSCTPSPPETLRWPQVFGGVEERNQSKPVPGAPLGVLTST